MSKGKCPVSLDDVDLFGPEAAEHWYDAYPILHRDAPVWKVPGEGLGPGSDGYILSKYEDIARVVRDAERFPPLLSIKPEPDAQGNLPKLNAMQISIFSLRPNSELWRAHRQELTDPWVGPGANRHTEMIQAAIDELMAKWIDDGEVELVSQFARPLPQIVMATVLGFPRQDIPQLERWGNAQVKAFVYGKGHRNELTPDEIESQFAELAGFDQYVRDKVSEKRSDPGDDMISWLTQTTYQALDRKLTDDEIVGIVYAMVIGGLETTQYAIVEQAQLLAEDPEMFQTLKNDRSKLRHFIEESLRVRSPTQGLSTRMTTQDEEFQGVTVPAGSLLHMRFAAGNVDPEEFECPYEIDLERKAVARHLAFSQGPRICPGAGISRIEQTLAWQSLLDRLDTLEYAPGNAFPHQPGIMLGTLELKLKFTKSA